MKETNALYKNIRLYNTQFDIFELQAFGSHKTTRLRYDGDSLLFKIKYMYEHNKDLDRIPELHEQFIDILDEVRISFCEVIKVFLNNFLGDNNENDYNIDMINEIIIKSINYKNQEVIFETIVLSDNEDCLNHLDEVIKDDEVFNMFPDKFFRHNVESYSDAISKIYPELFISDNVDCTNKDTSIFTHNFTFQTTEDCNLSCSYCYQINKTPGRMNFETAKKFIDNLLTDQYSYINIHNSPAIIIEFIGGDPLLEINLTRKIYEYFLEQCYELNHPWFDMHRISICTNGMLYFDRDVQSFFKKYSHKVSFNISIDGNKELQDSCRIQPNGEGSYDIDILALNHFNKYHTTERNSKMTLAPENMSYLFDSVVNFINEKMEAINLNCVFEDVWTPETATLEYNQLKKLADYLVDNDLEHLYIAIFDETPEDRLDKSSDNNWCFKAGTQVLTFNGNKNIEDIEVGDLIYTASGSIHEVTKTHSHLSKNNRRLYASGIFPIECTHDHKVFAKKFLYMGWKGVVHYSDPGFYPVSELKKGDRIALPVLDLNKNEDTGISEDMAYALGVYIADGCYCGTNGVRISPGYDPDKYYLNMLEDIGLEVNIYRQRTSMVYSIYPTKSDINRRFVELCKMVGEYAHTKHIPQIIYQSPRNIVQSVLDGYFNTDGYKIPDGKDHSGLIKTNTVSKHLANDLLILLRALGEYPTCYLYRRAGTMKIENRVVNVRDRYEVYYNPTNRNGNNQFKHDDTYPILWAGIREIDLDYDKSEVYCPTVTPPSGSDAKPEHSLIVNGLAASNCGGLGSMLALDYKGKFYPCIRYMPSSLGTKCKEQCIGHIDTGMVGREEGSEILAKMDNITRRSQSNDICFDCPIGSSCAWCFKAGTLIETERGPVPIEGLTKNDMILAQDGEYHELEGLNKRESFCMKNKPFAIGAIGTDIIYTTEEHPFWVKVYDETNNMFLRADWVEAKDIKIGDMIYLRESISVNVWTDVTIAEIPNERYDVYNLSVNGDPSYYANGILVHNCSGLCHQTYGTADKRTQFICVQMFAEHLANCYYWNNLIIKKPEYNLSVRKIKIPDEWALKVIDQEELEMLRLLETAAMVKKLEHSSKI